MTYWYTCISTDILKIIFEACRWTDATLKRNSLWVHFIGNKPCHVLKSLNVWISIGMFQFFYYTCTSCVHLGSVIHCLYLDKFHCHGSEGKGQFYLYNTKLWQRSLLVHVQCLCLAYDWIKDWIYVLPHSITKLWWLY